MPASNFLDFWFFSSKKRTEKNPGKDFVILGYQLDKECQGMIEVRDISGTLMQSIPFNGVQDQLTVITRNWTPGMYVISLIVGDKVIETTKFTLVN